MLPFVARCGALTYGPHPKHAQSKSKRLAASPAVRASPLLVWCCRSCFWSLAHLLGRFGGLVVVLFVVDLFAIFVLLFVDLFFLRGVQCPAVSGAVVVHLLRGLRLVGVGLGRFAGRHLTAAQPVSRPLLLVGFAVVDGVGFDGVVVVFFVVDLAAGGALFAVDLLLLL